MVSRVFLPLALSLGIVFTVQAEHDGKLQIVLLGDSTTEGSIPRLVKPKGPHFESVLQSMLAVQPDLPPCNVIQRGLSGEFVRRLLDSGRYDRDVKSIPGIDYIFIRYGINDSARRENFAENYTRDYHELITKLRADQPKAQIIIMTVIPFSNEETSKRINDLNAKVAKEENLPLFDIYPRYAAELLKGPDMLNYRRYPVEKVPAQYQAFVKPYVIAGKVVVMDNELDGLFGHLPGWAGDRHPNLAGYNVIADETAKYIAPVLRKRAETTLKVRLQSRAGDQKIEVKEAWHPKKTAMIVCDMWDLHHCHNAVKREGELAPRMNELLEKARAQGVLIIHAPSSCMKPYEGSPARERATSAPKAATLPAKIGEWCKVLPSEEKVKYPLDQTDGGEDDDPAEHAAWAAELKAKGLNPRAPWSKQIDVLRIDQKLDAISDSGVEIWNLLEQRGIENVVLMGVHLNMCVSGRPFGLRQMARNGKHVVLMRDFTDSMYNPAREPHVDHYRGTALFVEHVEKYISPTITSDQILGGSPFAFSGDPDPKD
ncbi:MAG: nicotinamidase-like amidase [Verrucomicrobiaceae bacterium]|nr:nicotinamidase-like amidase [Verrucomicrobiaceae bacterium]